MILQKFSKNEIGTDYVVGDIHGCFTALKRHLNSIGFDFSKDRLFSVGDLVDRGPESELAIDWLGYEWFHPVRGNHDDYVVRYKTVDIDNWVYNGGIWFQSLLDCDKQAFSDAFSILPFAMQVETDGGLIGIVHADPIVKEWSQIEGFAAKNRHNKNSLMWSRDRVENGDKSIVCGVSAVVCGHTPMASIATLGNVVHIDTAGWHGSGFFSVVKLSEVLK